MTADSVPMIGKRVAWQYQCMICVRVRRQSLLHHSFMHTMQDTRSQLRLPMRHDGAARQLHIVERNAGLQKWCCSIVLTCPLLCKQAMHSFASLHHHIQDQPDSSTSNKLLFCMRRGWAFNLACSAYEVQMLRLSLHAVINGRKENAIASLFCS